MTGSVNDQESKIQVVKAVDQLFRDYSFAIDSVLASHVVREIFTNIPEIEAFIRWVNLTVPKPNISSMSGGAHSFRIGRQYGVPLVRLDMFRGFYSQEVKLLRVASSVHQEATAAGAQAQIISDNDASIQVLTLWAEVKKLGGTQS